MIYVTFLEYGYTTYQSRHCPESGNIAGFVCTGEHTGLSNT